MKNYLLKISAVLFVLFGAVVGTASASATVNFAQKGSVNVHKFSYENAQNQEDKSLYSDGTGLGNQTVPQGAKPLSGVTFKLTQTHRLNATTGELEAVTNGTSTTGVTDNDGNYSFTNLELGRYQLVEVSAPGNIIDKQVYTIDVPLTSTDGTSEIYDVHVYPKNTPVRGSVELTKKGEGSDAQALNGAKFKLFKEDGTAVNDTTYTTENGKVKIEGLPYGKYYFQETAAPDGYALNNTKVPFEIKETTDNKQPDLVSVSLQDYKVPDVDKAQKDVNETTYGKSTTTLIGETVDFKLTATAPTDIADYTKFGLHDNLDSRLTYTQDSAKVAIEKADGSQGASLEKGTDYALVPADGQGGSQIKVALTASGIKKLAATDKLVLTFSAVVNTTASQDQTIPNTAVVDYDNNKGEDSNKESKPTETKVKEGKVAIVKYKAGDTSKTLEGATFHLEKQDKDGNWISIEGSEKTTPENGQLNWDKLVSGNYRLVETKAPKGYNLLAKPIEFTVNDGEKVSQTINVANVPKGQIPQTGGIGTILFTVLGVSLMGVALWVLVKDKKKNA